MLEKLKNPIAIPIIAGVVLGFVLISVVLAKDPETQPRALTTTDKTAVIAAAMGWAPTLAMAQSWLDDHKNVKVTTVVVSNEVEFLATQAEARLIKNIDNQ